MFEYLKRQLDEQLEELESIRSESIPAFNDRVIELRIPAIVLEPARESEKPDSR